LAASGGILGCGDTVLSGVEGRLAVVLGVDIGAAADEELHHGEVSALRGANEGGSAPQVLRIDVRAAIEQEPCHPEISGCGIQSYLAARSIAISLSVDCIGANTRGEEALYRLKIAAVNGVKKRRALGPTIKWPDPCIGNVPKTISVHHPDEQE